MGENISPELSQEEIIPLLLAAFLMEDMRVAEDADEETEEIEIEED